MHTRGEDDLLYASPGAEKPAGGRGKDELEKAKKRTPDLAWLQNLYQEAGYSLRDLAPHMGMGYASVCRMFNGIRDWKARDVETFAKLFQVDREEVMFRAGIGPGHSADSFSTPVVGWLDEEGVVHADGLLGPDKVPGVYGKGMSLEAIRSQGGLTDGWLFFCAKVPSAPKALAKLYLVQVEGEVVRKLRWVFPGYDGESFNIGKFGGSTREVAKLAKVWHIEEIRT